MSRSELPSHNDITKTDTLLIYTIALPLVQVVSVPSQFPSSPHVLLLLPPSSKPSSHVKVQVSPGLASPSPPSSQSIFPLSGAASGGHTGTIYVGTYTI